MARKTASRLEKRKENEAAEAMQAASGKKTTKKKTTKKKAATRTKTKAPERKRLVWAILNGSMKEEARFPYDQLEAAETKIAQLRARSKKPFFIQPLKEVIAADAEEAKT